MIIGIDFDNTIISYDAVFPAVAIRMGILPADFKGAKVQVKQTLLQQRYGAECWQELQGQVYGKYLPEAALIGGVTDFFALCRERQVPVYIVSHKTQFGHHDPAKINLRQAAKNWLVEHDFFNSQWGITEQHVFFKATRIEKIEKIIQLKCTHFIDDLIEVLDDRHFPDNIQKILFAPKLVKPLSADYLVCHSWPMIADRLFS